ncbi:hypothetical protein [Candidatus Nitrosocosmicus sp. T]
MLTSIPLSFSLISNKSGIRICGFQMGAPPKKIYGNLVYTSFVRGSGRGIRFKFEYNPPFIDITSSNKVKTFVIFIISIHIDSYE